MTLQQNMMALVAYRCIYSPKILFQFYLYRYRVCDSLHRQLSIGDEVKLVIEPTSIEGADGFYAQVGHANVTPYIQRFAQLEQAVNEFGLKNDALNATNLYK